MEQYNSIQQILKKENGHDRKPIYPSTAIQAVFDAKTGASLEAILAQFNSIYVQYQGTPQATRNIIPKEMRRAGLTITYMNMDSETITERAASSVQKDNDHWGLDINWSRVDELTLSGEISVSAQGTWIINGSDTGVKAVGPKGDAGITPWLKTIDNRLHVSYDNVNWEPCSEPISAYFRWSSNKIQISRDNKTWTDLSGTFADNLHIKGYVATTSALPSGAAQGDIYGVGPTYAAEDTARTNPIYRYYVRNANTWVDNGSFTSIAAGIVQETGDSENVVMSQKAVTEKLSELGSEISIEADVEPDRTLSNSYIKSKGGIGIYENFSVYVFSVKEGDVFHISFKGAGPTIAFEYAIYSSESLEANNAIQVGEAIKSGFSTYIKIPTGGVTLAVQYQISLNYVTIKKNKKRFSQIEQELKELQSKISNVETEVNSELSEAITDLGNFIFDKTSEKSISTILSKKINKDGSLGDYEYDRIDIYPVEEDVLCRIKGQTITGGLYAFAFYSSDIPSSDTLVKIGEYITTGGVVKGFDFFTKVPLGATHIAISRYKNPYTNYDSPLALYKGVYSANLENYVDDSLKPIKREVESLNSAVFTKVAMPIESEYIAGKQLTYNGDIVSDGLYGIYKVNVAPGEEYHFYRNYDIGSTGARTYALYSSEDANSNTAVEVGPEFNDPIDLTIKIPDGVVLMIVGKVTSYDTQVTKLEAVSKLDVQEYSVSNFAVQVISEEEISVTRRYSETEDLRVTFKKCGANKLMAIYSHSFINNAEGIPSFDAESVTKYSGTDWIGPYVIKADNREGSYNGFTGGWHGYNGDQTGAKTADTVDVRMLIDNRKAEIGNYYCDDVKIIVTNLIQAGNTKAEDGNGISVIKEVVTYHFSGTKIFVSVVMTALEDVSFNTYYGMQVTNYSQSIRYFADNVVYKEWGESANKTDKKNLQFFVCKGTDGRFVKAAMDIIGLGTKEYSIPSSIAFVSGAKAYYSLASSDWNKTLTLMQGEQAYWRGYYEFIPAEFTDSCIL